MSSTITESTVPVWRAVSPYVVDDTWFVSPLAALRDAQHVADGPVAWIAEGWARHDDVCDVNEIEDIATIRGGRVQVTGLEPFKLS